MIDLVDVNKSYGDTQILRDVSLRIGAHEFVALMGPSGSGKSTLSNILGLLDREYEGRYYFKGQDLSRLSLARLNAFRTQNIASVFQSFNLLAKTSVLENVELPLLYRGVGRKEREARALLMLKKVGLEHRCKNLSNELSGGEAQRVAIARAMVINPSFLIADEPTGNLDSKRELEIMELFCELNANLGLAILLITHSEKVASYASRTLYCLDGRVRDGATDKKSEEDQTKKGEAEANRAREVAKEEKKEVKTANKGIKQSGQAKEIDASSALLGGLDAL